MRDENIRILHRVKGKATLCRSARSLVLRVHRYGLARARTPAEIRWTARALDALDLALSVMDESDASAPQGEARLRGQVSVAARRRSFILPALARSAMGVTTCRSLTSRSIVLLIVRRRTPSRSSV
jgi:hypothetical protein